MRADQHEWLDKVLKAVRGLEPVPNIEDDMIAEKQLENIFSRFITALTTAWKGEATMISTLTTDRDAQKSRAESAENLLVGAAGRANKAEADLILANAGIETANARIKVLEGSAKEIHTAAAEIAKAAGHAPVDVKPVAADDAGDLMEQLAKIPLTDGRARAEFIEKHYTKLNARARKA